jgi:hypothetical protein
MRLLRIEIRQAFQSCGYGSFTTRATATSSRLRKRQVSADMQQSSLLATRVPRFGPAFSPPFPHPCAFLFPNFFLGACFCFLCLGDFSSLGSGVRAG